MKYTVIVEKGESGYGAFVPDLPGCIAVGEDREQTLRLVDEAVAFHIAGLRAEGLPVPRRGARSRKWKWTWMPRNGGTAPTDSAATPPFRASFPST